MQRVRFQNRAVAFLDVLGFKELVIAAEKDDQSRGRLERLLAKLQDNRKLNSAVSKKIARRLRPKALEISDSIILSTPLADLGHPYYWGLHILIMRAAQIANILWDEGYLVSGGIDVGTMAHGERQILGTGYQGAYALQATVSSPAIVLSDEADKEWSSGKYQKFGRDFGCLREDVRFTRIEKKEGKVVKEARKALVVNVLDPICMQSACGPQLPGGSIRINGDWLRRKAQERRDGIAANLVVYGPGGAKESSGIHEKWQWALNFINGPAGQHLASFFDDELEA